MAKILSVLFDGDLVLVGIRDSMCFFLNFTTGREVFPIGHATSASELKKFPKDEVADLRWKMEESEGGIAIGDSKTRRTLGKDFKLTVQGLCRDLYFIRFEILFLMMCRAGRLLSTDYRRKETMMQ